MRRHVDAASKHEALALAGVTALRMFIAGDDAGLVCGTAADLAHTMTAAMTKYLGIEAGLLPSPSITFSHLPSPSLAFSGTSASRRWSTR